MNGNGNADEGSWINVSGDYKIFDYTHPCNLAGDDTSSKWRIRCAIAVKDGASSRNAVTDDDASDFKDRTIHSNDNHPPSSSGIGYVTNTHAQCDGCTTADYLGYHTRMEVTKENVDTAKFLTVLVPYRCSDPAPNVYITNETGQAEIRVDDLTINNEPDQHLDIHSSTSRKVQLKTWAILYQLSSLMAT